MDLQPYVNAVRHELEVAASAAGDDARVLAERLTAPLDSALRLALLEALSAAAEEITGELAPGSVEVRLRGRDPEFVVTAPPDERAFDDIDDIDDRAYPAHDLPEDLHHGPHNGDGATWRVTLRLPEGLREPVEAAARREGASLNSWLVRATASASQAAGSSDSAPRRPTHRNAHRHTGWVR